MNDDISESLAYIQLAVAADARGEWGRALENYDAGTRALRNGLLRGVNDSDAALLREKLREYEDRMRQLFALVNNAARSNFPSAPAERDGFMVVPYDGPLATAEELGRLAEAAEARQDWQTARQHYEVFLFVCVCAVIAKRSAGRCGFMSTRIPD
jgi:hypothetical protein